MLGWIDGSPELLGQIIPQPIQARSAPVIREVLESPESAALLPRYTCMLMRDARPLGMVGSFPVIPGIYETWAYLSEEALQHPKALYSGTRDLLRIFVERESEVFPVERLQTHVDPAHERAFGWLRHLGFHFVPEADAIDPGWLRAEGPETADTLRYARFF